MNADQRVHNLITKRDAELEKRVKYVPYLGDDDFKRTEKEQEKQMIDDAIALYERQIIDYALDRHREAVVINVEATIANLLETLELPQQQGQAWSVNPSRAV